MYGEAEFRTGRGGVHSRSPCLFVILKIDDSTTMSISMESGWNTHQL